MSAHPFMDVLEALAGDRVSVALGSALQGPLMVHVSPWCAAPGCLAVPAEVAPQLVLACMQGRIHVPMELPGRCAVHGAEPRALPEPAI